MKDKYYNLIISLIKEHKKFIGLENILNDIAEDVLNKSRNIVGSIDDENVLIEYLNKVISCSILTVSKKMGYNKRVSQTLNLEKLVANVSVNDEIDLTPNEENSDIEVFELLNTDLEESLDINDDNQPLESETIEEIVEDEEEIINQNTENDTIDISLIDKMINAVNNDEIEEQFIESEELENYEIVDNEDEQILILEDYTDNLEINTEYSFTENISKEENTTELEEIEELDTFILEESDEINILNEKIDDTNIIEELPIDEDKDISNNKLSFPIFNKIEIDIENMTIDTKYVLSTLAELNSSMPNNFVLEICNLKFKEKLTIEEISEKLDITQEIILDILREISTSIKD